MLTLLWYCCTVELTEGCLDKPKGDLAEIKLEVKELTEVIEPFNKHLGDSLRSLGMGESLGKATGLAFAASIDAVAPNDHNVMFWFFCTCKSLYSFSWSGLLMEVLKSWIFW